MNNLSILIRNTDVILGNNDLEKLITFKDFPTFMGCVLDESNNDNKCDMNIYISRSSGIIQINPILPLEEIYKSSHGSGKVGELWKMHHTSFAKFIHKYSPNAIMEIGGGSGVLSMVYKSSFNNIDWLIVEPNPTHSDDESNTIYIDEFFDRNFTTDFQFDVIVHSHIFEHMFNPNDFVSLLKDKLSPGKKMVFSLPDLKQMFNRFYTNCINFEHTILLFEEYVDYLLESNKIRIIDKQYFGEGHSIFYATEQDDSIEAKPLCNTLYEQNKESFIKYINYLTNLISEINKQIKDKHDVYLFGAHVFSQFLINMGLDVSNIEAIIDNDINKQGKRLTGTNLFVCSPTQLTGLANPYVILHAAAYTNEIKHNILMNVNSHTIFV